MNKWIKKFLLAVFCIIFIIYLEDYFFIETGLNLFDSLFYFNFFLLFILHIKIVDILLIAFKSNDNQCEYLKSTSQKYLFVKYKIDYYECKRNSYCKIYRVINWFSIKKRLNMLKVSRSEIDNKLKAFNIYELILNSILVVLVHCFCYLLGVLYKFL